MFRRRPLMRAAVIGGGAYVAGKHVANKSAQQQQSEAEQDAAHQRSRTAAATAATGASRPGGASPRPHRPNRRCYDQLNQLAALHGQGVLTDDEFTAAKAKLLGT